MKSNKDNSFSDSPTIPKQEPDPIAAPIKAVSKPAISATEVKKPKKAEPSKKIDLGAAANYKGDTRAVTQQAAAAVSKQSDLLDDLFSLSPVPAASPANPMSELANDNFADFSQFPTQVQQPAIANTSQFADFESAFISDTVQPVAESMVQTVQQVPSFSEDFVSSNPFAVSPVPAPSSIAPSMSPLFPVHMNPMNIQPVTLLEPSKLNSPQHGSDNFSVANNNVPTSSKTELANTTWGNLGLNIDLDNLLTRDTKTAAPSMNQLAADVGRVNMNQTQQVLQPRTLSPAFGGKFVVTILIVTNFQLKEGQCNRTLAIMCLLIHRIRGKTKLDLDFKVAKTFRSKVTSLECLLLLFKRHTIDTIFYTVEKYVIFVFVK